MNFGAARKADHNPEKGMRVTALLFRRVGDSLLATPALRAVKKRFPAATVTVIAEESACRVFEHNPWIDEIVAVKPAPSAIRLAAVARRHGRPDVVLDFLSDPRSAAATAFSGAHRRVGFSYRGRRWAYTDLVPVQTPEQPVYSAQHKLGMAAALGAADTDISTEFHLAEDDHRFAAAAWDERGWSESTCVAAFFVHSRRHHKRWPLNHFCEVIHRLHAEQCCVPLVLATPGSESAVTEVRARAELSPRNVLGVTDLGHLGAALTRCCLLVGNDGGPKHIAVALNVPTVTIFPLDPSVYWTPPGLSQHVALSSHAASGAPSPADVLAAITRLLDAQSR